MPLVTDPSEAREIYQKLALRNRAMPAFCTENRRTTVAVLEAAQRYACETDQKDLPVVLAFTGTYPPRPQMLFYTFTRKWEDGLSFLVAERRKTH